MKKYLAFILIMLSIVSTVWASYPSPAGFWQFNDVTNLGKATVGTDLTMVGAHTYQAGIPSDSTDYAIIDPLGSQTTGYIVCTHGLAANGGSTKGFVNEWTLAMDVLIPASSFGTYVSLFQTNPTNINDADCFIRNASVVGTIGCKATGYSSRAVVANTWYRIVISVDNGSFYRIYVDGTLWKEGTVQAVDDRFALESKILLFADESGEDNPIVCTNLAIWGQALTGTQISELGNVNNTIQYTPVTYDFNDAGVNMLTNPSAENDLTGWIAIDGNDWQATDRTDWHWPNTGNYTFTSGRVVHGELRQQITIQSALLSMINSGQITANVSGYIGGSDSDQDRILVEYLDSSYNVLATADSDWVPGINNVNWTQFTNSQILPAGTRYVNFCLLTQRVNGTDCDAAFDDLALEFEFVSPSNNCPSVPAATTTPTSGTIGSSLSYTFVSSDQDADQIRYQIDWGNEVSAWSTSQGSGTDYVVSHSWPIKGTYTVKVRSSDGYVTSDWSTPISVTISGDAAGAFKSLPYLQNVSKTAITIAWTTDRYVYPVVDYGQTASYGSYAVGQCINNGVSYTCKVRITGLTVGTMYHFLAHNGSTSGIDATFTTAPNDNTPFAFAVWGDLQQTKNFQNAMLRDAAVAVDFGVTTGDIVSNDTSGQFDSPFTAKTCNVFGNKKPFFVAFGNHDQPANSPVHKAVQNTGRHSFSFNYGNAHFTCIDYADCVNGTYTSDGWVSSLPLGWIEQDLASDDSQNATWRFVFIHVPPYCERWIDGSSNLRTYLVPLMNQYNVQICFSGHTHEYQRGMLNGMFYVITGCGSYLDTGESLTTNWPHMTVGGYQNIGSISGGLINGWTEVQIDGTELYIKQHAYNSDGSLYSIPIVDTIRFALSDFNLDKNVDAIDLLEFADEWLVQRQPSKCDLDRDGTVNMNDFAIFADYWFFKGQF
jgi:predicted phosphodiesterase